MLFGAILGRDAAHNMDGAIAMYAPIIQRMRRITTGGKFAERFKDFAAFPDDADLPLASHRATLRQEPFDEIERSGCALGGKYYPDRDIRMTASSLNLVQIRINQLPASGIL